MRGQNTINSLQCSGADKIESLKDSNLIPTCFSCTKTKWPFCTLNRYMARFQTERVPNCEIASAFEVGHTFKNITKNKSLDAFGDFK